MSGNALLEDSNDGGGVGRDTQRYLAALEATKNILEAEKDNRVCRDKTLNNGFNSRKTGKNMADSRVVLACAHASLILRGSKETKDARSNHLLSNLLKPTYVF